MGESSLSMEIDPPFKENQATPDDWRKALAKVVPAVVVLRTTAGRAFDTESAGSSYATGFVVDKARGIILTNRHVVKPGPVVAEATFVNREEIPVYPIYRDPEGTLDDATRMYKAYAHRGGFEMKLSSQRLTRSGLIQHKYLMCNREGKLRNINIDALSELPLALSQCN